MAILLLIFVLIDTGDNGASEKGGAVVLWVGSENYFVWDRSSVPVRSPADSPPSGGKAG